MSLRSRRVRASSACNPTGQPGFTLVELLVVMFIVGLIVLSAAPFLRQGVKAAQANSAARTFYTDLAFARSLAIKTGLPHLVEICPGLSVDGTGTFTAVPGYMVIECSSGTAPNVVPDFDAPQCVNVGVCSVLAAGTTPSDYVKRAVNLLKGGSEARTEARTAVKEITGVTFGFVGSGIAATPDAPNSTIPADGIDLECQGTGSVRRRFFFQKNGQVVDDTGSHTPCGGSLYITSNMEKATFGAGGDASLNRAVEVSSAGGLRVLRWDLDKGWR